MKREEIIELNRQQLYKCAEVDMKLSDKERQRWDAAEMSRVYRVLYLMRAFEEAYRVPQEGVKPSRVLDVGAGPGFKRSAVIEILSSMYFGIEFQPELAFIGRGKGIRCCAVEDVGQLWGRDEMGFDFVFCCHVLEYCQDVRVALSALRGVMVDGAILGHITPYTFPDEDPAHLSQSNCDQWAMLYRGAGFEVEFSDVHHFKDSKDNDRFGTELHLIARRQG